MRSIDIYRMYPEKKYRYQYYADKLGCSYDGILDLIGRFHIQSETEYEDVMELGSKVKLIFGKITTASIESYLIYRDLNAEVCKWLI